MSAGSDLCDELGHLIQGRRKTVDVGVLVDLLSTYRRAIEAEAGELDDHALCDDWDRDELEERVEALEEEVEQSREQAAAPLASTTGDVNAAREHMRRHVEDLEHLPEWLRPELRALLHEGRLT